MHGEVYCSTSPKLKQPWFWRTLNKGRITGQNEGFPSRSNALRGLKAHITQTVKQVQPTLPVNFVTKTRADDVTEVHWG